MEIENETLFQSFLSKHLAGTDYDADAYLERLIIHWGETGEEAFSLPAEETASGKTETIVFSVKTRYFIKEGGQEIPVEDLSAGYDIYRPVLVFNSDEAVEVTPTAPQSFLNPLALIRHRAGRTLKSVSDASGVSAETLLEYEKPGYDMSSIPLGTAAAIAKALGVHAEALLSCAPTSPCSR